MVMAAVGRVMMLAMARRQRGLAALIHGTSEDPDSSHQLPEYRSLIGRCHSSADLIVFRILPGPPTRDLWGLIGSSAPYLNQVSLDHAQVSSSHETWRDSCLAPKQPYLIIAP
jgi:hypothetical protein